MGLLAAVSHKIISWAIRTFIVSILLMVLLDIPMPNVPMVLMIVLIGEIIGWAVASILGFSSRG